MRFNVRTVDVPANRSVYLLRLDSDDVVIEAYAYMCVCIVCIYIYIHTHTHTHTHTYIHTHTINRAVSSSTSP